MAHRRGVDGKTRIAVLLATLSLAACGHDDEGWLGCHGNYCVPALHSDCRVIDADLLCRLFDNFGTEVTAEARWIVSGPAVVGTAGYIRTTGYGEIEISAEHPTRPLGTHLVGRYLVDPGRPPRSFGFVSGEVADAHTKQALDGVRVTILDGYSAGRGSVASVRGYFSIRPVLTEEDFTWLAEKPGYLPATGRFRVRDQKTKIDPSAPLPPSSLDFEMARSD
jgi:hypothetical protein